MTRSRGPRAKIICFMVHLYSSLGLQFIKTYDRGESVYSLYTMYKVKPIMSISWFLASLFFSREAMFVCQRSRLCESLQHPIILYRALLQALLNFAKCHWQLYSLVCTLVCRTSVNQSLSKIQCTYSRVNARLFAPYLWILLKIQNIIFWTNWVSDQWPASASSEQRNHELWKLQNVSNIRDKKYVDNCQWPTLDILGGRGGDGDTSCASSYPWKCWANCS